MNKEQLVSEIVRQIKNAPSVVSSSGFGHGSYWLDLGDDSESSVYIRFRDERSPLFGRPAITLSRVVFVPEGEGTLRLLVEQLKDLCRQNDWLFVFENVMPQRMQQYLRNEDFLHMRTDEPEFPTLYWFHSEHLKLNPMYKGMK